MAATRSIITRLLGNLGSRAEVEQYLKHYGAEGSRKSAVIQVSGEALDSAFEDVVSALAFLAEVGLQPVVLHGARPQIMRVLEERRLAALGPEGRERVIGRSQAEGEEPFNGQLAGRASGSSSPEVLDVARRVSLRVNNRLLEALEQLDVRARSLSGGVFRAEPGLDGRYGLSGRAVSVDLEPVRWALRAGALPIISALGETDEGQILSLDPVDSARTLAGILRPYKLVFLDERGGLPGPNGVPMSAVNMAEDYETLQSDPRMDARVKAQLTALHELLTELPPESSVSFTSPSQLARELFTHTGAGTLVRLGVRINAYGRFDEVDRERLAGLLEDCFSKPLIPGYFEGREAHRIYLSDDYRATAVVVRMEGEVPYLDKFAVTAAAQGEGLGASLWRRLRHDQPRLFWRARRNNPINPWYFRNAQGSFQGEDWVVFWYGLDGFDMAKSCVDQALAFPPTFIE